MMNIDLHGVSILQWKLLVKQAPGVPRRTQPGMLTKQIKWLQWEKHDIYVAYLIQLANS